LTGKTVCVLVKAYAALIGLDAATIGAHSLRSGFLTSAARRGASVFKMRDVSRDQRPPSAPAPQAQGAADRYAKG
jgi:hypothetical protein